MIKKHNLVKSLRAYLTIFLIALCFVIIEYVLSRQSTSNTYTEVLLQQQKIKTTLSTQLSKIIYGLESDVEFIEKICKHLSPTHAKPETLSILKNFIETHDHYLKIRLIDWQGKEILDIQQSSLNLTATKDYKKQVEYGTLPFFKNLQHSLFIEKYFFSGIEYFIDRNLQTHSTLLTIRVAKKIEVLGKNHILIFNIDAKKIYEVFNQTNELAPHQSTFTLIDSDGEKILPPPKNPNQTFTLAPNSLNRILKQTEKLNAHEGRFIKTNKHLISFYKLPLPGSPNSWILISSTPQQEIKKILKQNFLYRLFWEILFFVVFIVFFYTFLFKKRQDFLVKELIKERNEFIENVSHQLKTPLTVIHQIVQNIKSSNKETEDLKTEVKHLIVILDDFLLLSQIQSLTSIPLQSHSLLEMVTEVIEVNAILLKEKNLSTHISIDQKLLDQSHFLQIYALPELLKSAILNLLHNACDFSPEGGKITFKFEMKSQQVLIVVSDQGPGISPELQEKLFHPFSREMGKNRKGYGLGLAIAKRIFDLHHATIRHLPSASGTSFEITFNQA
jgi:signal transduction histidine kinase